MIRFLIRGVLRDKNRSLLPIIVVALGVMLTVLLNGWIAGIMGDAIDMSAKFSTGHVKIVTKAYAENGGPGANDLAVLNAGEIMKTLETDFPELEFVKRINFGGLIDIAGADGTTKAQGPAMGMAIDLLSKDSKERQRLNIDNSIVRGKLPENSQEALISDDFAKKLGVEPGDEFTFFGSTMYGSMTFYNFKIAGTIRFGTGALDKGSIIIDFADAETMLDMQDAAGEILGYDRSGKYNEEFLTPIKERFNKQFSTENDEFAPIMLRLRDQSNMDFMLNWIGGISGITVFVLIFVMSIILWNTGLLGAMRRYNEFGVRLALGEEKKHIYRSLIYESFVIGLIGSIIGTAIGLGLSYWLQETGIHIGDSLKNSSMMLPTVYRAKIETAHYYIGFIPGVLSMLFGTALSGIGIYQRQTASLFKELEN